MASLRKQLRQFLEKRLQRTLLFIGIVIIFTLFLFLPRTSDVIQRSQYILTRIGTFFGNTYSRTFADRSKLTEERDYYRELVSQIATREADLSLLEAQVRSLESFVGYQATISERTIPARIIARSVNGEQQIMIDRGSVDGVREHLAVIVQDGRMIGRVATVRTHASDVRLLSDQLSSIPAKILGTEDTIGIVEGLDGFILHMQFIPQDVLLEVGDVVVTSGLDGYTPANVVIGIVTRVEKNETSPFKEAFVEPLVDPRREPYVFVLDPIANYAD